MLLRALQNHLPHQSPFNATASVTLTRTGGTAGSLTLKYKLSGTAKPKLDYVALPDTLTEQIRKRVWSQIQR